MGFRNDHDAALRRAEALEQELAGKDRELSELKAKLEGREQTERSARAKLPPQKVTEARIMGGVSIAAALGSLAVVGVVVSQWDTLLGAARQRLVDGGREQNFELVVILNHLDIIVVSVMSLALIAVGIGLLLARRRAATGVIVWAAVAIVVHTITVVLGYTLEGAVDATGATVMGAFPIVAVVVGIRLRRARY